MGPSPHLRFCANKITYLAQKLQVSIVPSPHLWFYAFKTVTLCYRSHIHVFTEVFLLPHTVDVFH